MKFPRGTPLLATALAVSLFAMPSIAATTAASTTDASSLPNLSSAAASESAATASTASETASTSGATTTGATTSGATTTGTTSSGATSSAGSTSSGTAVGATGLPTLSGAVAIVTPIVPDTSDAPFMQTSNFPEGTVFIIVGAFLGFLAMSVLFWRGLVSLTLRRNVRNAEKHQHIPDQKALFKAPAPPKFYNYTDRDSSLSLGGMGKGGRRHSKAPTNPAAQSAASLFFSPTSVAGAGINSQPGHRGSGYLPAGYYAAGAAAAANGQSTTQIGGGNHHSISLSNLVPQAQGYSRTRSMGPSPPDSPHFQAAPHTRSSSTLNLNQAPGEVRAPSAYLEDLFDGESGRESAAPVVPRHSTNYSGKNPNPGRF